MGVTTDLAAVSGRGEDATVAGQASPGKVTARDSGRSATPTRRLVELDGVRGLAALSVVCFHWLAVNPAVPVGAATGSLTSGMNWLYGTPLESFVAGQQMVLLFFVLSGMVLAIPRFAGRPVPYGRYLLTRALRLYPAAWAAAALAALVLLVVPIHAEPGFTTWMRVQLDAPLHASTALHFVTLILPFDPSRLDGPLWSLEQELRLSLLLPLLVLVVRRYGAVVSFVLAVVLIIEGTASTTVLASWSWTPVAAGCFLLGVLIARNRDALNRHWAAMSTRSRQLVGLAILVSFWIPERFSAMVLIRRLLINLIPILGACAIIIAAQGRGVGRWLRTRLPAWLGRISYSLYVVHVVVLHLLLGLRPSGVPEFDLAPAGIALSLVLATLMQRYVEAPAVALGRRLSRRPIEIRLIDPAVVTAD